MNISTTFLNALKHTSSDVEGQRSPEILLGQIYKVSLEDKGFLLPLAGGEFRLLNPFYYEWNPFPSYLLLYTLEGSALLTTRDNGVILDHEHLLFLDCSQGFSLRLLQGKWRFQMFFLSGRELSSYYSIFEAYFTCCYPIPIGSCVSQRMQQLTKFPFTPTPAEQLQIHREADRHVHRAGIVCPVRFPGCEAHSCLSAVHESGFRGKLCGKSLSGIF